VKTLAGLALGLLLAAPALAEGEAQSYRAASERFDTLAAAAEAAKSPELLQGGEAEQLVALLADGRFLDASPDLPTLVEYCQRAQNAVQALALFGAKARLDPKDGPEQQGRKLEKLQVENVERFGQALAALHPFLVRCTAAEIAPMTRYIAALKPAELTLDKQQGLVQFHAGLAQMFAEILRTARDERYDAGYRLAVLKALAQGAPALAGAMPLAARKQVRPEVEAGLAAEPEEFGPAFKAVGAALDDGGCGGLCGY
jgi:hypothetical protein